MPRLDELMREERTTMIGRRLQEEGMTRDQCYDRQVLTLPLPELWDENDAS